MEFRIHFHPDLQRRIVVGEGPIVEGDASRFEAAAQQADRDDAGLITLALSSPGGSVRAALEMVDVMDTIGVYAVVPDNAFCASACASVLYVSAEKHMVLGTGRLGLHTCYRHSKQGAEPSSLCNETIGKNAILHGVPYAAVEWFIQDFGPERLAIVDRTTACEAWLCRPNPAGERPAGDIQASFDCKKAKSVPERLICSDRELARLDRDLAAAYREALATASDSVAVRRRGIAALKQREAMCRDRECVKQWFKNQLQVLWRDWYENMKQK